MFSKFIAHWCVGGLLCVGLLSTGCKPNSSPTPEPDQTTVDSTVELHEEASVTSTKLDFKSRYDRPTNSQSAPTSHAPIGHAVAVAGYDLRDPNHPQIMWMDPADNLVDDKGVHRWSVTPKPQPIELDDSGLVIDIDGKRTQIVGMVLVESIHDAVLNPASNLILENMPDLSQHIGTEWQNYCAPTVAADVLYSLRGLDSGLSSYLPLSPQGLADTAATQCIAGLSAPLPREGSLASLMESTHDGGTSAMHMVAGLQKYLAANASNAEQWRVRYVAIEKILSSFDLTEKIQDVLANGGGAMLVLYWSEQGQGQGQGDRQNRDEKGHRDKEREGEDVASATAPSFAIQSSGKSAVDSNQISQAGAFAERPASQEIDVTLPLAPEGIELPPIQGVVKTKSQVTRIMLVNELHGRWRQIAGKKNSDFAAGGYRDSEILFGRDGVLGVTRFYGATGEIVIVQEFKYEMVSPQTIVIKPLDEPKALNNFGELNERNRQSSESGGKLMPIAIRSWIDDHADLITLPTQKQFRLNETRLELMDKIYQRIP